MPVSLLFKSGPKVAIVYDECIISKSGAFVGKGYACDEIFKLNINKVNVSTYIVDFFLYLTCSFGTFEF